MPICICDISALEIYRSCGRLLPELLEKPRTSKLDFCTIPDAAELDDILPRIGAKTKPYHLAVNSASIWGAKPGIIKRVLTLKLPNRSLIKLKHDILITGPELTFCMLASLDEIDVIELAFIGFELCGTYILDSDASAWKGFINTDTPITSVQKIKNMLDSIGQYPGAKKARKAISLVANNSNSPMETVQAALLGFPRSLGGIGFGPYELNYKVATPSGNRYVDFAVPDKLVGFEYKGRSFHTPEQTGRDDRRQNRISGSGYTILNVWYEDLVQKNLFDELIRDASRAMGIRTRIRSNKFESAQHRLRMRTLPAFKRYENI